MYRQGLCSWLVQSSAEGINQGIGETAVFAGYAMNSKNSNEQFDRYTLRTIISALVLSKLFNCSTVWSNTTATNIKKLHAVQNFPCRIITKTKKFEHITPALGEIKWLPVNEHLHYRDTVMTFRCMKGLAPTHLCESLRRRKSIHYHNTKKRESLDIPPIKTKSGQ